MAVFDLAEAAGERHPAPLWFVDWVRLGIAAAKWSVQATHRARRVVAVSAPTEAIAASAVAFGFVRATYLAGRCTDQLRAVTLDELQPGSWIWFRAGSTARTARFLGFDARGNFCTSNGRFLTARVADVRELPPVLERREATANLNSLVDQAYLRQMLRACDPLAFATTWSTRCLIVGSVQRITEEMAIRVGPTADGALIGAMDQVVRPFDPENPSGCQTLVQSARADEPDWLDLSEPPTLTILRGAYATSRWLPDVASPFVVSILGRAEAGLEPAVAGLLQARAYGEPLSVQSLGWRPPAGCEVLAFEEVA